MHSYFRIFSEMNLLDNRNPEEESIVFKCKIEDNKWKTGLARQSLEEQADTAWVKGKEVFAPAGLQRGVRVAPSRGGEEGPPRAESRV